MFTKIIGIIIILAFGLTSCLKPEEFPKEPVIEFVSFTKMSDSADIIISFVDGDGDIGLQESDTIGDFHSSQKYHHNLFVEYYEKHNANGWQIGKNLLGDDIVFKYRIPYLTPNGRNKALKGEIKVTIEPSYFNPLSSDSDTVKFKIYLVDRSFTESNVVESNVVTR